MGPLSPHLCCSLQHTMMDIFLPHRPRKPGPWKYLPEFHHTVHVLCKFICQDRNNLLLSLGNKETHKFYAWVLCVYRSFFYVPAHNLSESTSFCSPLWSLSLYHGMLIYCGQQLTPWQPGESSPELRKWPWNSVSQQSTVIWLSCQCLSWVTFKSASLKWTFSDFMFENKPTSQTLRKIQRNRWSWSQFCAVWLIHVIVCLLDARAT
jgi:hypothetical protein